MNIVVLGGTGYIGREVTRTLLSKVSDAHIFTVSRTGENELSNPRITNLKADCTNAQAILKVIPSQVDIIIDLVGGMNNPEQNIAPAKATAEVAGLLNIPKIGYVGGALGSKTFLESKRKAAELLKATGRTVVVVNPTLVYGNGRNDAMAKMVPLLKFLGLFSKRFKPVTVESVATELVNGLLKS